MKKLILGLMSFAMISLSANAQETKTPAHDWHHQKGEGGHEGHGGMHHKGMMMQKLNLTDAQKEQMKTINGDCRNRMEALKKNDNMTMKDFRTQKEAIEQERKSKVLGLLTPEQKTQMEQLKKEGKEKREKMGEKRLEKMTTELSLSPDQVNQMKAQHESFKTQAEAIKSNQSLSEDQKKDQIKALHQQGKDGLKNILTADQLKKWEERKHKKMKNA